MKLSLKKKLKDAFERDPEIFCERDKAGETLGSNPDYLSDILGIQKSDLLRLERLGLALKARYETENNRTRPIVIRKEDGTIEIERAKVTGPHRTRWLIFKEALDEST